MKSTFSRLAATPHRHLTQALAAALIGFSPLSSQASLRFDVSIDDSYFSSIDYVFSGNITNLSFIDFSVEIIGKLSGSLSFERPATLLPGSPLGINPELLPNYQVNYLGIPHFLEYAIFSQDSKVFSFVPQGGGESFVRFYFNWIHLTEVPFESLKPTRIFTSRKLNPQINFQHRGPAEYVKIASIDPRLDPDGILELEALKAEYGRTSLQFKSASDSIPSNMLIAQSQENLIIDSGSDRLVNAVPAIKTVISAAGVGLEFVSEYLGLAVKTVTLGAAANYNSLANDPPDQNYTELAPSSGEMLDLGFIERFGQDYALFDDAFIALGTAIEESERLLITLERIQGALLAEDRNAIEMQTLEASNILTLMDDAQELAALKFLEIQSSSLGASPELFDLTELMRGLALDSRPSALLQQASPVPEPTAAYSLLAGLALLGLGHRRRSGHK